MKYKGATVGFIAGVIYALICAALFTFAEENSFANFKFISSAMFFATPLAVGVVTSFFATNEQLKNRKYALYYPWYSVLGWTGLSILLKYETLICIIMLLPIYLPLASLGGFIGVYVRKNYCDKTSAGVSSCFAILPLMMMPIEGTMTTPTVKDSITDSIVINAPIEKVWAGLPNVENIQTAELPWTFSHFIGIPKPITAKTPILAIGGKRDILWEKGVKFTEVLTEISENKKLAYDVFVDKQSMEIAQLDTHIVLGDQYFNVNSGYYSLVPEGNKTRLNLTSSYTMTTRLNWFGRFWSNLVLSDFHYAVLHVIKNRVEKAN